jgi:hypothetical protein
LTFEPNRPVTARRPDITLMRLLALTAIVLTAVLAACGGVDEDAQEVIDRAFAEPIESADVSLSADLSFEGSEQLAEPIRVQVSGPFRSGGSEQIPSFDFDVALQGAGGQVPPIGLVSTGDNVFIEVQGVAYEVGEDVVAEQNRQLAKQSEDAPGLGALGVDPRDWIVDATVEDETDVAGEPTTHVSAAVDIPALVGDLNEAAQQATAIGAGPAPELTDEQVAQFEEAVEDPTFDLFASEEDGGLRRLATAVGFEVPQDSQAGLGGATGGTVSFSLEFANVDGDQQIAAPDDPQPLADLAQQLGGLGGILGEAPEGAAPQGGGAVPVP